MELTGRTTSYKCIVKDGNKTSFASNSQAVSDESYSFPNRQYNGLVLSREDEGNEKQIFSIISKRKLELSPTPWDQNYSRISSKLHEHRCRFGVKKLKRPFRVETPSTNVSENLSD